MSLGGCAEQSADAAHRIEQPSAGPPHAVNDFRRDASATERLVAQVELEIGEVDGDGPAVFGSVIALEADERGTVYVLDGHAQEVRVFGPDGTHLHTLGGRGEGPGEFMGAGGLNLDAEGALWVWDPRNGRFTRFSASGEQLGSVRRGALGVVLPWRGEFEPDGRLIDWSVDFPERTDGMNVGRTSIHQPIRTDLETGALDTLPPLRHRLADDISPRAPWQSRLTYALGPDGVLWFAVSDAYTLYGRTLEGDTLFAISLRGVDPVPVSATERDSVLRAPDPLGDITGDRLRADALPTTKPVIARLIVDGAGTLYVFPHLPGHEPGSVVDIFETDNGRLLGRVLLPRTLALNPPPVAVPGGLVGVTRGEMDVAYVVRIGITPAAR